MRIGHGACLRTEIWQVDVSCLRLILVIILSAFSPLASTADIGTANPAFPRTIYLVRHGAYDVHAKVDSEVGGPLTPLGIAEARLVGARLRGLPLHFDSITSSTMARARETAEIIRESLPQVKFSQSSDLSECAPPTSRPLEDESLQGQAECLKRLDHVFAERFTPATNADGNDLIVAHGNVIRYFVMKALGVDTHAWLGFSIAHASLTVIRVRADGTMSVISVGDIGHIPPNLQSWGTAADPQLVGSKTAP
jgi:serine/threonine-protein phosphatase PGAM5